MIVLCIARIIDAGTGINGVIIGTSTFWRFDFLSGVVMLAIRVPVTYLFIVNYGIVGSAYAEIFAYTVYNIIRFEFLRRKFNMQPFDKKTIYCLAIAVVGFVAAYFIGDLVTVNTWLRIAVQTAIFSGVIAAGTFWLELSPDVMQLYYRWVKGVKD